MHDERENHELPIAHLICDQADNHDDDAETGQAGDRRRVRVDNICAIFTGDSFASCLENCNNNARSAEAECFKVGPCFDESCFAKR